MRLNDIQVAGLRAMAAVPTGTKPEDVIGDLELLPVVTSAYTIGVIDGKAALARELLQEAADRGE